MKQFEIFDTTRAQFIFNTRRELEQSPFYKKLFKLYKPWVKQIEHKHSIENGFKQAFVIYGQVYISYFKNGMRSISHLNPDNFAGTNGYR